MNHSKRTLIMFTAIMSTALWIQTVRQVPAAAPASAASAVPEELQSLTRGLDLGSLLDLGGILQEMGSASSGSNVGSSTLPGTKIPRQTAISCSSARRKNSPKE